MLTTEDKNEVLREELKKVKDENEILKKTLSDLKIDYNLLLSGNEESIAQVKETIEATKLMQLHYEDAMDRIKKLEEDLDKLIKSVKESKITYEKRMNTFMSQMTKTTKRLDKNEKKTEKKIKS